MSTGGIVIRSISSSDVDAATRIETAAFAESRGEELDKGWEDRLRLDIIGEVADESDWGLVIEEAGSLIGVCHGGPYRDWSTEGVIQGVAKVTGLAIDPELWDRGYGRALLTSALDVMRDRGFEMARLWVEINNARAMRLFESCGFRRTGRLETDDDQRVVEYELPLGNTERVPNQRVEPTLPDDGSRSDLLDRQ